MPLLVPILPLMDGAIAEPDSRRPHGMLFWSTDVKALLASYHSLGVQWVHFQDLEGQRLGRPVEACAVTEIAVLKDLIVSVEGGIRTWQDARMYLGQAVDLVYLGRRDGWQLPFAGIGQAEVERRLLVEFVLPERCATDPELALELLRPAMSFGVIPVLQSAMPWQALVRVGNLVGVEFQRRLMLRPEGIADLSAWRAGLRLTGGFVQAVLLEHRTLESLGLTTAVSMALEA